MRSLEKQSPPPKLVTSGDGWREKYEAAVANGGKRPRVWAKKFIRDALLAETNGKCAYCESRIEHVGFAHIEHIKPRVWYPSLVVDWANLTLACERCNVAKSDYYSEVSPIINPYQDPPERHIAFTGAMVVPVLGSGLGTRSIYRLRLGRADLTIAREERLRQMLSLLEIWQAARRPEDKEMYAKVIEEELTDGKPYTSACRAFVCMMGFPLENSDGGN